jgi:IS1 family transposase
MPQDMQVCQIVGSVLIWALAALVGVISLGIIYHREFSRTRLIMAAHRYVSGNSQSIAVLGVAPKVDVPGFLILQVWASHADCSKQLYQTISDHDRHFSILPWLQRERLESSFRGTNKSCRQAVFEDGQREVTVGYASNATADICNVELYRPWMRIWDSSSLPNRSDAQPNPMYNKPWSQSDLDGAPRLPGLLGYSQESQNDGPYSSSARPTKSRVEYVPTWAVPVGILWVFLGMLLVRFSGNSDCPRFVLACGFLAALQGGVLIVTGYDEREPQDNDQHSQVFQHNSEIVRPKTLTHPYYWFTVIDRGLVMANVLSTDKKIAIIGQLAEGSSIRSIERIIGVHRDTIMRLGVKVGQGCTSLMDDKMRNLPCNRLEMDEIWGFIGKKDRHVREGDDPQFGNVWTFCAIDAETKLVPAFRVGQRDAATANAFLRDVASRMTNRVQISTDGLNAYVDAVEMAFGGDADYGQIIKTYGVETSIQPQRRYSAPEITAIEKKAISGRPNFDLISTSYVERLNATTRLHMKRLARLTHAFSKKRVNFEAAVGLHFAYYNFVKRHSTIRCTPAMAAGVTGSFWSVGDLVEAAA